MFGWFQRLLPKKGDFFGMFEAHAATLVAAAQAMAKLVDGGTATTSRSPKSTAANMRPTRSSALVLTSVRRTFLTPSTAARSLP